MPRNIALVGCGAVARAFYLPVLAKHWAEFGQVWLVDPSQHALSIATSIVPGRQAHGLADVDDDIHLVIIATPNQMHFSVAQQALARGADVLIEKPFVIWPEEGRILVETAAASNRLVAINQTRRLSPLARELRRRINEGAFGALKSIIHREGGKLIWPFESGAAFTAGAERTGVIMDIGVHIIDFYHYVLQPEWNFVSAIHDGFIGPEGLAEIELHANGAPVSIRLSRYFPQENVARLVFDRAEIAFSVNETETYSVRSVAAKAAPFPAVRKGTGYGSYGEPLVANFIAASEKREPAVCDAASSLPVIDILDEIYRCAGRYPTAPGSV